MTKIAFDLDNMSIYQRDNKYYATVSDSETYNSAWYNEGSAVPKTTLEERGWVYTLIYDETSKKWLVNGAITNYFFAPKNKKEFTF